MNITVNTDEAYQGVKDIKDVVQSMKEQMEILDNEFKKQIPTGINTNWSNEVLDKWTKYYGADVPAAMEAMLQSATNLQMAVEAAEQYSKAQ